MLLGPLPLHDIVMNRLCRKQAMGTRLVIVDRLRDLGAMEGRLLTRLMPTRGIKSKSRGVEEIAA